MPFLPQARALPTVAALLLIVCAGPGALHAAGAVDPASPMDHAVAAAEASLRKNALTDAERQYRRALYEGWRLTGTLAGLERRLPVARDAFRKASTAVADNAGALLPLAAVHLEMGEAGPGLEILEPLARANPRDLRVRRVLGYALVAAGRPEEAVRELREARAAAPEDLELAFALASAYLHAKDRDQAARLFAEIVASRPIPQTRVLIGRTYRECAEYEMARSELEAALKQDPRVRHAHYYLAMLALRQEGRGGIEEAVAQFQAELRLAPEDPLANLELGAALVESQRAREALPALEIAARADPQARGLYYLGRSQLASDRTAEAVNSLEQALALGEQQGANEAALRAIHVQLGQALRAQGDAERAAAHFNDAEKLSARGASAEREQLARYMAGSGDDAAPAIPIVPLIDASPLEALSADERRDLGLRVAQTLARCYLNLGVIQARGERFAEAALLLEQAAEIQPGLPQVQSSLGVAYFNARQFAEATGPLTRALASQPADVGLKRMLAMAWLDTQEYAKAAELLEDDPEREENPSLQFAYGLALVKSERGAEAERAFSSLLARHGDSAELSVLLGQAHAQQGDFDAAVAALERALRLKVDVPEAHSTLGEIYLRQGKLPEAEAELRAELTGRPDDLLSRQHLAIVLDSQQRREDAIALLRGILEQKPDFPNTRYLLGKLLLAQGASQEATLHLEAAARLAPEDASVAYQLARAYQALGRTDEAQQQFDLYRQLKDKR